MKQSEMLHRMCHEVLSDADVKAVCKARQLPRQATSSRSLLESLFLTETGIAAAMATLDRTEVALLHQLSALSKPVDVSFFTPIAPPKRENWSYGTFTQRFQSVFAKARERLVRRGVLLLAFAPETFSKKTTMERWRFLLPTQFAHHLPPLIDRVRRFDGSGDWQSGVARAKLKSVVDPRAPATTGGYKLEIVDRELRLSGEPFRAARLLEWQTSGWHAETGSPKRRTAEESYALSPADAAAYILGRLEPGVWCDPDALREPLEVFCSGEIDSHAVCESGWRWGRLARQESEGKSYYRLVPPPVDADVRPDEYLNVLPDGSVVVNLNTVGFESLEALVTISDQRPAPAGRPSLLIAPNLVKLGRAADAVASLSPAEWLRKNSPEFHEAFQTVQRRRGKTILHEKLSVARVGDLSLRVALEKALGDRVVSLGDEFIAFPLQATAEVRRIVAKSGHVIKEAAHRDS